jgi:predicted transposase/invertase (TIGR01784 family)
MANYWIRLYGKYPNKEIHQVVIYLKPSNSPLVYQTKFSSQKLNHEFNVIRLWEQSTEVLQSYLGLLPLSVLSKTDDPIETLRKTAKIIDNIENRQVKNNVSAATAIISGLALSKDVIQKLLRSDIMKESVIYQDILLEGTVKGKAEGKAEERNQIALKMLRSKMAVDLVAQFTGLSVKQVEKLQKFATESTKITKPTRAKRSPNA